MPNHEALALAFNREGLLGSEDAFSLGGGRDQTQGGMITFASHKRMVEEARLLAARASNEDNCRVRNTTSWAIRTRRSRFASNNSLKAAQSSAGQESACSATRCDVHECV